MSAIVPADMGRFESSRRYLHLRLILLLALCFSKANGSNGKDPNNEYTCPNNVTATRCNYKFECDDCSDELNCEENSKFSRVFVCESQRSCVWVGNACPKEELGCPSFCDGVRSCSDGSDEPHSGFGFRCPPRTSHVTVHNKRWCVLPQKYIKRWKDETNWEALTNHTICPDTEDAKCYPKGSHYLSLENCFQCTDGTVINKKQLCDGKFDCLDYSDECLCRQQSGETLSCLSENNQTRCVSIEGVCNGTETCFAIGSNPEPCKEQETVETLRRRCPSGEAIIANACDGRPECKDLTDECSENCTTPPSYCKYVDDWDLIRMGVVLDGLPVCEEGFQFCNGIQECDDGIDEAECPTRRPCKDSKNTTYDVRERCDFTVQCEETQEDELHCDEHFYCDGEDSRRKFINRSQIRDGFEDCANAEDECGDDLTSGGQYMIESGFLMVAMWLMAAVALIGNAVVIVNSARDLRATYRRGATAAVTGRVGACNKTLVLNLALADFLMGIYLLILNIKAAGFSGEYCRHSDDWRSSSLCSGLGALAVLSSQTSVVIMVMMTTYRLYSVRMPFRADKLRVRYLVVLLVAGWIIPAIVAFSPLASRDKAFALSLKSNLPFFESRMVEKPDFENFVRDAWKLSNFSSRPFGSSDWHNLMDNFCTMYSEVCDSLQEGSLVKKWFGYYSADSVCLPRLFPHVGDSGWEYTVAVITFDFVAFLYILTAYLMMYSFTVTGTSESGNGTLSFRGSSFSSVDELRSREDRVIWQRISRLLFTDFLCWIPICVTCLVSLLSDVIIPPVLYQISAIIFLPVNSALNPVLYSNVIKRLFDRFCPTCLRLASCWYHGFCKLVHKNGAQTPPDDVRLNYVRAASASDELKLSADQLAGADCTETRSFTLSETDKTRAGVGAERCTFTPRKRSASTDENVFLSDMPPINEKSEQRNGIAKSMAKFGRFFSERNHRDIPPVRRPRPKSQSTTSTSTFFTTINQND